MGYEVLAVVKICCVVVLLKKWGKSTKYFIMDNR